jgi:hypothetical protein
MARRSDPPDFHFLKMALPPWLPDFQFLKWYCRRGCRKTFFGFSHSLYIVVCYGKIRRLGMLTFGWVV